MRILLTNDDGINAPGILALAKWAMTLGEVTVVAPKIEQSGKSHGIEIVRPMEIKKVDFPLNLPAYAVDSTPADCVRYAVKGLGLTFDLVISGINRGFNVGEDIMYSGTVGAIFEANAMNIPAMAFSADPSGLEDAAEHLGRVYRFMCDHRLFETHNLYNINIPKNPQSIRITRQGGPYYKDHFVSKGGDMYLQEGYSVFEAVGNPALDTEATLSGHISILPLTLERTHMAVYQSLSHLNEEV